MNESPKEGGKRIVPGEPWWANENAEWAKGKQQSDLEGKQDQERPVAAPRVLSIKEINNDIKTFIAQLRGSKDSPLNEDDLRRYEQRVERFNSYLGKGEHADVSREGLADIREMLRTPVMDSMFQAPIRPYEPRHEVPFPEPPPGPDFSKLDALIKVLDDTSGQAGATADIKAERSALKMDVDAGTLEGGPATDIDLLARKAAQQLAEHNTGTRRSAPKTKEARAPASLGEPRGVTGPAYRDPKAPFPKEEFERVSAEAEQAARVLRERSMSSEALATVRVSAREANERAANAFERRHGKVPDPYKLDTVAPLRDPRKYRGEAIRGTDPLFTENGNYINRKKENGVWSFKVPREVARPDKLQGNQEFYYYDVGDKGNTDLQSALEVLERDILIDKIKDRNSFIDTDEEFEKEKKKAMELQKRHESRKTTRLGDRISNNIAGLFALLAALITPAQQAQHEDIERLRARPLPSSTQFPGEQPQQVAAQPVTPKASAPTLQPQEIPAPPNIDVGRASELEPVVVSAEANPQLETNLTNDMLNPIVTRELGTWATKPVFEALGLKGAALRFAQRPSPRVSRDFSRSPLSR